MSPINDDEYAAQPGCIGCGSEYRAPIDVALEGTADDHEPLFVSHRVG
ncbi:hypothetical protein [Curtobacterium flaccumfaciens]